jgi:hypothetical protein
MIYQKKSSDAIISQQDKITPILAKKYAIMAKKYAIMV